MLTYAFDLLYAIYEEQGYQATDIPRLILTHNLYGIEIDQRAGALAAFALTMKAREKYRRFLTGGKVVQPNICVLENIEIDREEFDEYVEEGFRGEGLGVSQQLQEPEVIFSLNQFKEADNFGSLIRPQLNTERIQSLLSSLNTSPSPLTPNPSLLQQRTHQKVLKALRQADYLSPKYHVVVANPPYMGRRNGMNDDLKAYINKHTPHCKADLYAAFIQISIDMCQESGFAALVTMQSWMFLSSYKGIREEIVKSLQIVALAHLGPRAFAEISGEVVQVAATVLRKEQPKATTKPVFVRLVDGDADEKRRNFLGGDNRFRENRQCDFEQISDCPLAYWLPRKVLQMFSETDSLEDHSDQRQGLATGDDDSFLRIWHEVSSEETNWQAESFPDDELKWYPFLKGGSFRKWYGNNEHCILFDSDAFDALAQQGNCLPSRDFYLRQSLVWSDVTSCAFGARFNDAGKVFATGALSAFPKNGRHAHYILGYMNCVVHNEVMAALSSGIHYSVGYVDKSPLLIQENRVEAISELVDSAIEISRWDWDSREISWDFSRHSLVDEGGSLARAVASLKDHSIERTATLRQLEQRLNQEFLEIYGLAGEYGSAVENSDVSLDCNPAYRYGSDKSESELEALLLADTMREFISYAVGCMLGRYSLDAPGLILANAGESIEDYYRVVSAKKGTRGQGLGASEETATDSSPSPLALSPSASMTFEPDADNVIPLLDGDWFEDDITERFKAFLKVTFGTEHYEENFTFLENALYPDNLTGKKRKTIRDYFLKEFYNHHIKLYKKRPIYWLFSSPKGTFNALIYMHRYRPDTVSVILNDYLREFQTKLAAKIESLQHLADSADASKTDKTRALKQITELRKGQKDLEIYEKEILYPLAQQQIEIDLDDGVKVNYNKFGKALKKVTGLTGGA